MPSYEIKAADESRNVVLIATVDTATRALTKLRDANERYRRVWVIDDQGVELSGDQLLARSWNERKQRLTSVSSLSGAPENCPLL